MKKILSLLIILLVTNGFSSCEKDDICDSNTVTTPRLAIDFYSSSTGEKTNVTNLKVVAEGESNGVIFNDAVTDSTRYLTNANRILIPFRTDRDLTKYSFTLNSGNPNTALIYTDTIQFNYSRRNVYVSRACGFKTLFDLNNSADLPPYIFNNSGTPPGHWMRNIIIDKYNLENENETHLRIYL